MYSDCVTDGQTGLLVENDPDRWYEAMLRLVEDAALRAAIQRQARAHVCEHYSQERFEEVFWKQIEGLLGSRPPLAASQGAGRSPAGNFIARGAAAAGHTLGYLRRRGLRQTCLRAGLGAERPLDAPPLALSAREATGGRAAPPPGHSAVPLAAARNTPSGDS